MLKVIHLFSGVGAPEMALRNIGIPYEIVGYSEIDRYAIQAYKAIHGEDVPALGSVTDIDRLPKCDLLFYGSPCQDFSIAGKQRGLRDADGNQTRSGLLLEVERLLEVAKEHDELPKYLIMENVKNLVSKKFEADFGRWLDKLDELGYNCYWNVLDARDYGVPQHRERVFAVSIRKDIDFKTFYFPAKTDMSLCMRDILEACPAVNMYLSADKTEKFLATLKEKGGSITETTIAYATRKGECFEKTSDVACTLLARDYKGLGNQQGNVVIQIGNIFHREGWDNPQCGRVYSTQGVSPTLNTMQGGWRQPLITEETPTTIQIRKLTPLECWRLMGFSDDDYNKAKDTGLSNTQLYKQAGNSIVVPVLEHIFANLLKDK